LKQEDHNQTTGAIHLLSDGFRVDRSGHIETVKWCDIREIVAFKRDILTYDVICVGFCLADREYDLAKDERLDGVEIHEEMTGFMDLVQDMQRKFPAIPKNWYIEIMTPAFETIWTTLWKRE
jgi:hypothetical protein